MHWRRNWQPTPVFLPGESQGQGSLVGCRLWSHTELDTTEVTYQQQQQHGLPKRCWFNPSFRKTPLEKGVAAHSSFLAWRSPMDRGGWRATVHRVTKSQTQLKQLNVRAHTHTPTHTYIKSYLCAFSPLVRNSRQDLQSLQWLYQWEGAADGLQHASGSGLPNSPSSPLPL